MGISDYYVPSTFGNRPQTPESSFNSKEPEPSVGCLEGPSYGPVFSSPSYSMRCDLSSEKGEAMCFPTQAHYDPGTAAHRWCDTSPFLGQNPLSPFRRFNMKNVLMAKVGPFLSGASEKTSQITGAETLCKFQGSVVGKAQFPLPYDCNKMLGCRQGTCHTPNSPELPQARATLLTRRTFPV